MSAPQSIVVLGSTGSIGTNSLDVIRSHPERLRLRGLVAHSNGRQLLKQANEFSPDWVVLADQNAAEAAELKQQLGEKCHLGDDDLAKLVSAEDVDTVVSAIVGAAGLQATWHAVKAGKKVALANKESLVVAGSVITQECERSGASLLPVDSEHSAIFQAFQSGRKDQLRRIVLTASGGPFFGKSLGELENVTPQMALNHPTWNMGPKVTVDSATMMNKALEIIEARWLFDVSADQISVVVHPQSIIHSFVEFQDGAVICQMSPPDMRLPIQYALTYPERLECPAPDTDWTQTAALELHPPDFETFPSLQLGFDVARSGGTSGAVLNAANEIAVQRFLDGSLEFLHIVQVSQEIIQQHNYDAHPSLADLQVADNWARQEALRWKP